MKRLIISLALCIPGAALLGTFAATDSDGRIFVGIIAGGLVGALFGAMFGSSRMASNIISPVQTAENPAALSV